MYARVVADTPPVISSITPRSHVTSETELKQVLGQCRKKERSEERTKHGGEQDYGGEEDMSLEIKRLMREEKLFDDLMRR